MSFNPREILFAPTWQCNLKCLHCFSLPVRCSLSPKSALKIIAQAKKNGITRVGFTGGEPFLYPGFVLKVIAYCLKCNLLFSRIMTNGVWYKSESQLCRFLKRLKQSGYDGEFCVSIDVFHARQNLKKTAAFIRMINLFWNRPDAVTVASVFGKRNEETIQKLKKIASLLKAEYKESPNGKFIKNDFLFIKIIPINLSWVKGKLGDRKLWKDNSWFKDDYCQGPGNVLFIEPDGLVKPCCGYANYKNELSIGNINKNSIKDILENASRNNLVKAIFKYGLGNIRKRLEKNGVNFPGKTKNHCFFCNYILTCVDKKLLYRVIQDTENPCSYRHKLL